MENVEKRSGIGYGPNDSHGCTETVTGAVVGNVLADGVANEASFDVMSPHNSTALGRLEDGRPGANAHAGADLQHL